MRPRGSARAIPRTPVATRTRRQAPASAAASTGLLSPPALGHLAVSLDVAAGRQQLPPGGAGLELAHYQGSPLPGWVPPLTTSSPVPTGSPQAAHTVRGWNSAPQVCSKTTGAAPGFSC